MVFGIKKTDAHAIDGFTGERVKEETQAALDELCRDVAGQALSPATRTFAPLKCPRLRVRAGRRGRARVGPTANKEAGGDTAAGHAAFVSSTACRPDGKRGACCVRQRQPSSERSGSGSLDAEGKPNARRCVLFCAGCAVVPYFGRRRCLACLASTLQFRWSTGG